MVLYIKLPSFAMSLQLELDELCTTYQKLLLLLPQSWKRLDMLMLKMRMQPPNQSPPRRPSTSRSSSEQIIFLHHFNASCHLLLRRLHFLKVMHPFQLQKEKKALKTKKLSHSLLLIPLLTKVRLRE